MKQFLTKAVIGASLAATALGAAAPAEAQRYRYGGGYYGHHDHSGAYLAAGIAGLAVGAALTSNRDPYRDRWYRDNGYRYDYDSYYYNQRGYYPTDGYYAYQYRDRRDCRTERRYDRYYGRPVRVQVCY